MFFFIQLLVILGIKSKELEVKQRHKEETKHTH